MSKVKTLRYVTPEDALRAMFQDMDEDVTEATWHGITLDGEERDVSFEDLVAGIRQTGVWGFTDGATVHFWAAPDCPLDELLAFFAHELSHIRLDDHRPVDDADQEAEVRADIVGGIARDAYALALMAKGGQQ